MTESDRKILVTLCARQGSKGVPGKNIRPLLDRPLIAHSIAQAQKWGKASEIIVSTDSSEIAQVAQKFGALVPFIRPEALATDSAGKLPVLSHALRESEKHFKHNFDIVLDLDVTAPVRSVIDIENGFQHFLKTGKDVVLSVTRARKNPYFNMLERNAAGRVILSKSLPTTAIRRQDAPPVWDANASIYFYNRDFLLLDPTSLWQTDIEIFEMGPETAFDIDDERDFVIVEALLNNMKEKK